MKSKIILASFITFLISPNAWPQRAEITAEYGPPANANAWEKFTIPITPEAFSVTADELQAVLSNVSSFWIRTEMHTGNDVGGIDNVMIGSLYSSYFGGSSEGWSSGGDGTMEWVSSGGYEGGFLQISDWASGDWHWLISPAGWAGDWTSLTGDSILFWFRTDQPSYAAIVKITSDVINRLVIGTPVSSTILPNDSVLMQLEVIPVPGQDVTVSFSTSNSNCIKVPGPVVISAGDSTTTVYFHAASGAQIGCTSVIEATASGYLTSRVTMMVLDNYGIGETDQKNSISVYPNPSGGRFTVSCGSGEDIRQVDLYDLTGRKVLNRTEPMGRIQEIDVRILPAGLYILKILSGDHVGVAKINITD